MTLHTPGPWHTSTTHSGAAVDIGAANGANVTLVSGPTENGADEFRANARLIAAAPDLLAALEFIVSPQPYSATQEWRDNVKKGREMALAAIAKATS